MWKTSKNPDVICQRYVNGLFFARSGLPEPNHHRQSTYPSSSITLVNLVVFPSVRKFNSNRFCLIGKSNPTSGSKVTDYGNSVGRAPQALFERISVFQKCISVFPTTCEDPAQSVESKCHIGKWIWRSESQVMVESVFLIPTYQTVFGSYLGCISRILGPYFCMSDLTGGRGSIWSFRKSPRKVKSEVWVKSYGRSKSSKKPLFWPLTQA